MTSRIRALLFGATLVWALAGARPVRVPFRDLDVGLPPGSPLDWSASLPAYTPPHAPLFPETGPKDEPGAAKGDTQRSSAKLASSNVDVRVSNAFGQVRILTWDLTAHLEWIQKPLSVPRTGRSGLRPPDPVFGEPLFWLGLAPLLRLLLHPDALSRSELLAHLVEIGEPALPVLGAAASEKDLAQACRDLRALIRVDNGPIPSAPAGGTPRQASFARFVLEECLRDQPMDPCDDFGRRLYLFAAEAEPLLVGYSRHPSLELARNAVSALARYESRTAVTSLAALAARVEDPVTLVRALAGIARYHGALDTGPLIERLRRTTEPVQRSALIGALGHLGAREAAPLLVQLGETALEEKDSDLLLSVLAALARIAWTQPKPEIAEFLRRVEADVRGGEWHGPHGMSADIPDPPTLRATMLRQLALLARSQVAPLDKDWRDAILAMAEPAPLDPRLSETGVGGTDPLGSLGSAVKLLYLEGLLRVGEEGTERLNTLAESVVLDTALRGKALALLPYDRRSKLAAELLMDEKTAVELRIQALEVLIADVHPELASLCRAQLVRPVLQQARPPAGDRFLALRALRYLSETGKLHAAELLPLFPFVQRPIAQREAQTEQLKAKLSELIEAVRGGERGRKLAERAGAIFDFVQECRLNPLSAPAERDAKVHALLELLPSGRAARNADEPPDALVRRLMATLLGGEALDLNPDPLRNLFQPEVPLAEEVLLALGRTHEPQALELLLSTLAGGARELRAHAALALGMCAQPAVAEKLLPVLLDEDPFVRFCAAESLRHLTGKEIAIDWMAAPAEARQAAAEEYKQWFLHEKR